MGEVSVNPTGLLPKISSLFNSPIFSDVEFVFISDTRQIQRIFGHKLILALRSKVFSSMFFDGKESCSQVRLPSLKRASFLLLLRFLYTDDVQFCTYKEAEELLELANEYAVEELVEICYSYILQERLSIENVLPKYEYALKQNVLRLLKDCQDFVCSNVEKVLESTNFTNTSAEVVEDIVKQDNLSVVTEIDVITAVLRWGSEELKRKEVPADEKHLRKCINLFLKHLRFLTLSQSEFEYFIENFNIFTGLESSILTRKIFQPNCNVSFPESLCDITTKRSMMPSKITPPVLDSKSKTPNASESPTTQKNKISYEVKKLSSFKETCVPFSQLKQTKSKFCSSQSVLDKGYLCPNNMRDFEFPLLNSQPCFQSSFRNDIKCSVTFKMKRGNFRLCGFELKVKNKSDEFEELVVDVDLQGFLKQSFSRSIKKELKNNVLTFFFPDQMVLCEKSKGELEVSVDSLFLNRCCTCNVTKGYELNVGLNFACDLLLTSNKKTDNGFLFLISRLLYVPG